jgi:Zn-dependent metalloprotease
MYPQVRELTHCPAIFWEVDDASFVIIKTVKRLYRRQFYYRGFQQYGTSETEFDDMNDCTVTLLQVHADKEAMLREEQAREPDSR